MKSPSGLWDSNLNPQVWFLGFLYLYFTLFANTTYKNKKQTNQKKSRFHVFKECIHPKPAPMFLYA